MGEFYPITAADYPALAEFCAAFPHDRYSEEQWRASFAFWWERNPAFSEEWRRGWMVVDAGRVVGMLGVIPTRLWVNGAEEVAANLTTWRVAEEHRGVGALLLVKSLAGLKRCWVFDTTPAPATLPMIVPLGLSNLLPEWEEGVWFLDYRLLAGKLLAAGLPGWVAWPGAGVGLAVQRAWGGLHGWSRGWRCGSLSGEEVELDRLWAVTCGHSDFTLVRDRAWWEWLLRSGAGFVLLGCRSPRGRLAGVALMRREGLGDGSGRVVVSCWDLWTLPGTPAAGAALIRAGVEYGREVGAVQARFPGYHPVAREVFAAAGGVFRVRRPATIYCRAPRGSGFSPVAPWWSRTLGDAGLHWD